MRAFECITFAVEGRIARIVLNRPDAGNSMNMRLVEDLAEAALICDGDPDIKVVLLTATGRMFCAGGDLKAFAGFGDQTGVRIKLLADQLHKALSLFSRMSKPLVIAVNGAAAGAGFSLAIAGDYVLAAQSAKFTMAYTAAGLTPDGGATHALPRLVGLRRAQELIYTNRLLSAQEAADWGLITRAVADDALESEAQKVCEMFAAGPAEANATVKSLLQASLRNGFEEQMELEGRGISRATMSHDGAEGIQAFVARRKPRFA